MEDTLVCKTCKRRIGHLFATYRLLCEQGIPEKQILDSLELTETHCRGEMLSSVNMGGEKIAIDTMKFPAKREISFE